MKSHSVDSFLVGREHLIGNGSDGSDDRGLPLLRSPSGKCILVILRGQMTSKYAEYFTSFDMIRQMRLSFDEI